MRLFLVRHGQTEANVLGALDTALPGAALTELGRQQAATLPTRLQDANVSLVLTSDRIRTQQTASALLSALQMELLIDPDIREIDAGDLEMNTDEDSLHTYHRTVDAWSRGELHHRMPGGETGLQVIERFDAAVGRGRERVGGDGALVVIAHGAVIRTWARLRSGSTDPRHTPYLENTGIVEMAYQGDAWRLLGWMAR